MGRETSTTSTWISSAAAAALALTVSGCGTGKPVEPAAPTNQAAINEAEPAEAAPVEEVTPEQDSAEAPVQPTDDFYDACLLGRFPTGGLIKLQDTRAGDFIAVVANGGGDSATWIDEGNGRYVFRTVQTNNLTGVTNTISFRLRQTNTAPVEGLVCGPRAVVVEGWGFDGQEGTPLDAYTAAKQVAAKARQARESGALGILNYHPPADTSNDPPPTERIVDETDAAFAGLAREMGGRR